MRIGKADNYSPLTKTSALAMHLYFYSNETLWILLQLYFLSKSKKISEMHSNNCRTR